MTFQVFKSHMWLVPTILDSTRIEHFYYCIKFCWTVLVHSALSKQSVQRQICKDSLNVPCPLKASLRNSPTYYPLPALQGTDRFPARCTTMSQAMRQLPSSKPSIRKQLTASLRPGSGSQIQARIRITWKACSNTDGWASTQRFWFNSLRWAQNLYFCKSLGDVMLPVQEPHAQASWLSQEEGVCETTSGVRS